ncbi:hypothetical protein [Paracoccus spongiarum]|uniref:Peptidase S8/S53 domain-containing protein n=1 Tax=Paracoccus spongiarum TaxID=3064387 RepID=A0ABT9JJ09_9RHOB|nr:hypothetical protein [Paracoccus sp. 2205BS29-5]MDP5309031.1 hypothetical protein [Paracoccus sp. 2205BS29-5]
MKLSTKCGNFPYLPWNFLPIVDDEDQVDGEGVVHGRMVATLVDFSETEAMARGYPFLNLPAETLRDPVGTNDVLSRADRGDDTPYFIGSRIVSAERSGLIPLATSVDLKRPSRLVLIDCGLAHWNDAFWPDGIFRFSAIYYYPEMIRCQDPPTKLDPLLAARCRAEAASGGPAAPIPILAKAFPGSVWSLPPDPDDFWHGTATAGLVAGTSHDLVAFELPKALLLDWGGDKMTLTLWIALFQAIAGQLSPNYEGKVLLPFGFTGGPQDGDHPAARKISKILNCFPKVELILPAGNHRQDRLHARLTAAQPKVIWGIQPSDASANVLDLCVSGKEATFTLRSGSNGQSVAFTLKHGDYCELFDENEVIGRVHARQSGSQGQLVVRLALEPALTAGIWEIEMRDKHAADLWILRDDEELALNHMDSLQSRFFDHDYSETGDNGFPKMDDGNSVIRRAGSASVLTTAPGVTSVAATVERAGATVVARYSGLPWNGNNFAKAVSLGVETDPGLEVIGNGSPRRFLVEGTSIAAARYVK